MAYSPFFSLPTSESLEQAIYTRAGQQHFQLTRGFVALGGLMRGLLLSGFGLSLSIKVTHDAQLFI